MKKLSLLMTLVGLCGLATTVQAVNTNALLVTIQISGIIQKATPATNSGVVTTTYTTTPAKIANADILNMIEAEFSTQFPTGAKLGLNIGSSGNGFVVLNQNGDLIMDVATNPADSDYRFDLSNGVTGAASPQVYVGKEVNNHNTTNDAITVTIDQPDYGIFYQDGQGNNFHFTGLVVEKASAVQVGGGVMTYSSVNVTMNGTGGGDFFNPKDGKIDTAVFTSAKLTGTGKNLVQ